MADEECNREDEGTVRSAAGATRGCRHNGGGRRKSLLAPSSYADFRNIPGRGRLWGGSPHRICYLKYSDGERKLAEKAIAQQN